MIKTVQQRACGFTIIEVIIVVGIMAILCSISFSLYVSSNKTQALQKAAATVVAVFEEAHSLAVANTDGSPYGVHIDRTAVIRFAGAVYNKNSSTNVSQSVGPYVTISTTSPYGLAASSTNVVFSQLSGTTSSFGTVGLSLVSATSSRTVSIYSSGLVEISK